MRSLSTFWVCIHMSPSGISHGHHGGPATSFGSVLRKCIKPFSRPSELPSRLQLISSISVLTDHSSKCLSLDMVRHCHFFSVFYVSDIVHNLKVDPELLIQQSKDQPHKKHLSSESRRGLHRTWRRDEDAANTPKYTLPQQGINSKAAYQLLHDETALDGNPLLNLAS